MSDFVVAVVVVVVCLFVFVCSCVLFLFCFFSVSNNTRPLEHQRALNTFGESNT